MLYINFYTCLAFEKQIHVYHVRHYYYFTKFHNI